MRMVKYGPFLQIWGFIFNNASSFLLRQKRRKKGDRKTKTARFRDSILM